MGHIASRVSGLSFALVVALGTGCSCESATATTLGAPCLRVTDCSGGLACSFGSCRSACTTSGECGVGGACLLDEGGRGACSVASDLGCASAGRACSAGLLCVADRCERTCARAADCPDDRACTTLGSGTSACLGPDADAGAIEAGAVDAALDGAIDAARDQDAWTTAHGVLSGCLGTSVGCVVTRDHALTCWGEATNGALGDGGACADTGARAPMRVAGLSDVDVVACGDGFVCAHTSDGLTQCWGRNDLGQLGRGTTSACEPTPAPVVDADGTSISIASADLVAAGAHACALTLGTLLCWGRNDGLLDVRASADPATVFPHATDALQPLRDAAAGTSITGLALSANGAAARVIVSRELYLWGDNAYYQTASTVGPQYDAVLSIGAGRGTSATAGRLHRCSIDAGGVICWGDDGLGQLGHPPDASAIACGTSMCETPGAAIGSFLSIRASGDGDTTCGVTDAGSVRCWGDNARGLAGVPASTRAIAYLDDATSPVAFPSAAQSPFSSILVGARTACAIDTGATLWCWGDHDLDTTTADITTPAAITIP